jgi:hypothetical protein
MAAKHPLADVFGFPIDSFSSDTDRYCGNQSGYIRI